MIPCGARNCGRRGPPPPARGAPAWRPSARSRGRRDLARLVVDEVEVEDVVVVHGHGLSPTGRWRTASRRNALRRPSVREIRRRRTFPCDGEGRVPCLLLPSHSPTGHSSSTGIARSSRSDAAAPGSVWLARDERTGLEVALKIVPREGKRAARAAREMEAASRLRHERCVRAYDFGGDGGHVYIAYEYVQGRTLRETLRAG